MGQQVLVRCKQVVIRADILNESRNLQDRKDNNINTAKKKSICLDNPIIK
jgi:hypothetical protein